jgi:hypothetical protein
LPQRIKYTIKYINKLTTKYGEKLLMEISIILLNQNFVYSVTEELRGNEILA